MKILVAYASGTGTTEKCARLLAEKLPGSDLCDLKKNLVDPSSYDAVIVGGSIRFGALASRARTYLEKCEPILAGKRLGLFICCASADNADDIFARNIPEKLLEHAAVHISFGGELAVERARGVEKLMLKMMLKSYGKDSPAPQVFPERIAEFAEKIMAEA